VFIWYFLALFNFFDHFRPIFLLNLSLRVAAAFAFLINGQMAQTVILQIDGKLKIIAMISTNFDVLPFEIQLHTVFIGKMHIIINSGNSLRSHPVLAE